MGKLKNKQLCKNVRKEKTHNEYEVLLHNFKDISYGKLMKLQLFSDINNFAFR